ISARSRTNREQCGRPCRQRRYPDSGARGRRPSLLARHPDQLLQAAHARRHRLAGVGIVLPGGPGNFADIDVAVAVDAEAVRRGELAGRQPGFFVDPADHLTLARDDAEARPEIREILVDRLVRPQFADVADAVRAAFHVEAARSVQIVPLGLVFAVAVEDLHAMVLTVGDVDPAVGVADDVVRDVELARTGAAFAPGE